MADIGYVRVSTSEQDTALQRDALVGCAKIFEDTVSGAKRERPGLDGCLSYLREGDTLCVWRLDRLGRSLKDLIERVTELDARGVGFRSVTEQIDTTSSGGKLVFHIFGAMADLAGARTSHANVRRAQHALTNQSVHDTAPPRGVEGGADHDRGFKLDILSEVIISSHLFLKRQSCILKMY